MDQQLNNIKNEALALILEAESQEELEQVRVRYLSKKGNLNQVFSELMRSAEDKKQLGQVFNQTKQTLLEALEDKQAQLSTMPDDREWFDVTKITDETAMGMMHPINLMIREMNQFFRSYGFSVMDGPEIESDEYNFQRLNLPPDHPARDLQDTLYIKEPNILLRTHTSSVETRVVAKYKPPFRVVVPGKSYRYETMNPSNTVMFFQYQGFNVERNISMSNLKWILEKFVHYFYGTKQEMRFRCKYYPEVEPTAGLDLACSFCNKKGCAVCKYRGWLEMIGCGMMHPNIMKTAGIDPQKWSGFAWGMGLDRLVMTKFNIPDVRMLTNGSITYPNT